MGTVDSGKTPIQFGDLGSPLFGWYHPPAGTRRAGGVVLCNPLGDDLVRAHRPLRHLAERLAAIGFPVLRFDYRGTGDAAGDEHEPARVAGWLSDIARAIDELRRRGGVASVAMVGYRAGATLAAAVAAGRDDVSDLVAWSGHPSGGAFVDDAVRTHRLHRKLEPHAFDGGPALAGGEEALGFFLTDETMRDLRAVDLATLPRRSLRALVVAPPGDKVAAALEGFAVERRQIPADRFAIVPPHQGPLPAEALAAIVTWLDEGRPERSEGDLPAIEAREAPIDGEEPHRIGGRLFAVLHRPAARRPELPAIVLLNAGCVPRFGAHRQYLPLARRWVALGFPVLRLDLSGIGDSPAATGAPENITYPPSAAADVATALTWMTAETGADRFVLAGLCSGADIAFAGAGDPRVDGIVMMNPRTFLLHDLDAVESFKGARWYQEAMFRRESWTKLLRGDVDLLRVARTLAPKAARLVRQRVERLLASGGREAAPPSVPERLRHLCLQGIDVLLVVAPHDPGVDYVDANHAAEMRALRQVTGFRRAEIAGTDHTFTALWAQRRVADLVTEHLTTLYRPEPSVTAVAAVAR
jgi:dienelactone hydrolase